MSSKSRLWLTPVAWSIYIVVVLEFLFMISPFALYFYAAYGPALNFLHRSPATAWVTGFFLPHFSHTHSWVLNELHASGESIAMVGLLLFAVGAVQIYGGPRGHGGAVTRGLYAYIRHPQYVALALLGLGTLLIWPRFLALISYVTMLFLYGVLARWEEVACEAKYGAAYRAYEARTGMFLPRALVGARRDGGRGATLGSPTAMGIGYVMVLGAALALAFGLRSFALSQVTSLYTKNVAVLSPAVLSSGELSAAFALAMADSQVQGTLRGTDPQSALIVYVIPAGWYLPDLPVEVRHELGGHRTPADFDRRFYKVLITRARSSTPGLKGPEIVTHSFGRDPLILARVDIGAAKVTGTELPPAHVVWGDIPTPMF